MTGLVPGSRVLPDRLEAAACWSTHAFVPRLSASMSHVRLLAPDRRRGEELPLAGVDTICTSCPLCGGGALHRGEREEADQPVLAALRDEVRREVHRRRGAEVEVVGRTASRCSSACSCRAASPPSARARSPRRPSSCPVPRRVAARDEEVPAARHDDRAGRAPRSPASLARHDDGTRSRVPVRAERVPDVEELPAGRDHRDVPLVRRPVAEAARRRDHVSVREVERRRDLLPCSAAS